MNPRTPHDIPSDTPLRVLVEQLEAARLRSASSHNDHIADDLFASLAVATRIAHEAVKGHWSVTALLLRIGAVSSWEQVGAALGVDAPEARGDFDGWVDYGIDLYRVTRGTRGLTEAEADDLRQLAAAVPMDGEVR